MLNSQPARRQSVAYDLASEILGEDVGAYIVRMKETLTWDQLLFHLHARGVRIPYGAMQRWGRSSYDPGTPKYEVQQ